LNNKLDNNLLIISKSDLETDNELISENVEKVWLYCSNVYPERFFDILYQNKDIFKEESDINCEFLPGINFKQLWICEISEKTRETIWKYLQLILFAIVAEIKDHSSFGETAKLFEAINEDELKKKLEEAVAQMQSLFEESENGESGMSFTDISNISLGDLPNPEDIHNHITSMMEGKLGKLAREIAEETAQELQVEMEGSQNINDVFKRLFKNPTRIMDLVKSVGSKMENKLKSGEIKESELLQEAGDLMAKMKNMPGMDNMQNILSKMGIPGLGGKGAKMNFSAMQSALNQNIKTAQTKDRMRAKLAKRQQQDPLVSSFSASAQSSLRENENYSFVSGSNPNEYKFVVGEEKVERSLKSDAPSEAAQQQQKSKKKKNKKKKVKEE
jgi:hypothetical protein